MIKILKIILWALYAIAGTAVAISVDGLLSAWVVAASIVTVGVGGGLLAFVLFDVFKESRRGCNKMKLILQKHEHGFYISNKKKSINVPKHFMERDPFQETVRFLHLLGIELEIKGKNEKN